MKKPNKLVVASGLLGLAIAGVWAADLTSPIPMPNQLIDYQGFQEQVAEVGPLRAKRHVYELGPLLDINKTRLRFERPLAPEVPSGANPPHASQALKT